MSHNRDTGDGNGDQYCVGGGGCIVCEVEDVLWCEVRNQREGRDQRTKTT